MLIKGTQGWSADFKFELFWIWFEWNWCPSAAVATLPMNAVFGNVLLGYLNGTMTGGVFLVPGLSGNALYIDDGTGHVDLGFHQSECFYNPDNCSQGVTFAVWMRRDQSAAAGYVLDTGARSQSSNGKGQSSYNCVCDYGVTINHYMFDTSISIINNTPNWWYFLTPSWG